MIGQREKQGGGERRGVERERVEYAKSSRNKMLVLLQR